MSDGDGYEGRCLCDRGTLDPLRVFASLNAFVAFLRRLKIQKAAIRITRRMKAAPPMMPPISGFVRPLPVGELPFVASTFGIAVAVGVSLGTAEAFDVFAGTDGDAGVEAVTNVDVKVCACELLSVVVKVSVNVKVVTAVE